MRRLTGRKPLRLCVGADPLVIWRWGGWFFLLLGCGLGLLLLFVIALLDQAGSLRLRDSGDLLFWFLLPAVPLSLSFQRASFDNAELIVRVSYWVVFPVWRESIPYAAVKGVGTDYRTSRETAGMSSFAYDLYLYTRSRRKYFLERFYSEREYRGAVERITHHVRFAILRFD